ncbi:MAG: arsenate reductase (glutaredoxin) [Pseudomonadota bacterium]
MSDRILWHNPRCSKSRQALALLEENGAVFEIYAYLEAPPDRARLDQILGKLKIHAAGLLRTGQSEWKASGLTEDAPEDQLRDLIIANPILIERPILEIGDQAIIGRPPERVLQIL